MDNIQWHCKSFTELSIAELYEIMKLRSEVFVLEQNCVYLDADGKDEKSYHFYAVKNGSIAAYARLLPPNVSFKEASIGRLLTAPSERRKGLGIILMQKCIAKTLNLFETTSIKIGGQLYLQFFYEGFQFKQCSEVYDEDGIPHIEMVFIKMRCKILNTQ